MMRRLLKALSSRLPCRIISDGNKPYLERYYLATLFAVRFYVHRFVASDPDRGQHDHPWPWAVAVMLSGFYIEERRGNETGEIAAKLGALLEELTIKPKGVVRRRVRWFNWLTGDTFHRVVLPCDATHHGYPHFSWRSDPQKECWTLFAHRAKDTKPWGFLRDKGQIGIEFQEYQYPGGQNKQWWKTAPKGRDIRRAA